MFDSSPGRGRLTVDPGMDRLRAYVGVPPGRTPAPLGAGHAPANTTNAATRTNG
ncbi:hypothetical protein [Streptomyces sp. NBC_00690]|uniref:hypothetical protein n=1 Tax=Streptomyces sp. NBC_00690 TaxID=2975808 RepID=UPI002E2E38E3|nr:hypothetical protein [Streptomyces sp. NBC_00690]